MTSLYSGVSRCLAGAVAVTEIGDCTAVFRFPEAFIGFAGHFPQNPVLPGIAQILAAQITAAGVGNTARLVQVKRCKFLRPVLPDETMVVQISLAQQESLHMAKAQLFANGEPCATMSLLLSIAPDHTSL